VSGADPSGAGWSAWTGGEAGPGVDEALRGDAGRYARVALLGRGGMGEVVLARDARLRREVAVKRVAPGAPDDAAALLVDEARLTAHLEHPGIVAVHDLGVDDEGAPWVALAVVRGRTLEAALVEAPPEARLGFVRPLLAVCEAVAFAHRAGVVHRDLKPANVLVGDLGEVQVADWGLAATLPGFGWEEILGERPRRAGSGTPAFMAPEQAAGAAPSPAADVYSLGAVLAAVVGAEAPVELAAVIGRATAARPEDRYPSAAELADDLRRWLDGRRVRAHAYTTSELLWRRGGGVAGAAVGGGGGAGGGGGRRGVVVAADGARAGSRGVGGGGGAGRVRGVAAVAGAGGVAARRGGGGRGDGGACVAAASGGRGGGAAGWACPGAASAAGRVGAGAAGM
jgi:hypothetical protein